MANRMREPVGYRPFRMNAVLSDRIEQPAFGGDLWERTSAALARAAGVFGEKAKVEQAKAQDARDLQESLQSSTGTTSISGGAMPELGAGDLSTAIDTAAQKYGQDAATLRGIAQIESGGNVKAYNGDSRAAGAFQFVPGTARAYGLENPYDPAQAADAAARLLRDNRAHLAKTLGRDPTPGELYLAHQQGAGGAADLLRNPDRLASSVVPLKNILGNGGRADMTAGEFARLWTDRMGGAPSISRTAPPVRSSNPTTPFGRHAQDYWQRIQVSLDTDVAEIEKRFADDPAGMTSAFTQLRKAYAPQILPELQADFDVAWRRSTAPALAQAGDRAQKKLDAADKATFAGNITQAEADRDQAVEAAVPGSEAGLADLDRRQGQIDAQYDAAVARGYMTPLQALDAKTNSRRATASRWYERQAEALQSPEDVAALRQKFHDDYAAGKLDGLDQQGWQQLDSRVGAIEQRKRTEGRQADAAIKTRADDVAARVAAGGDAAPAEINQLIADAATAPNGEAIVRGATAKIDVAKALRDLPVDEAEAHVDALAANAGATPPAEVLEAVQFGRQQIARTRTMLAKDPLGLAAERGLVGDVPALDLSGNVETNAVTGAIADRVVKARAIADHYGITPRYLRPGEARDMAATLKTDPDRVAATLNGFLSGSNSAAPDILKEISETSQPIADAGALLLAGGSGETALDLLRGASKAPDGREWKSVKPEDQGVWAATTLGNAFDGMPGEQRRLKSAAALIARYRLAEQGLKPDDSGAQAVFGQALQEAAGASFQNGRQWGGIARLSHGFWTNADQVKIPGDVDAARFGDLLDAIRDDDIKANAPQAPDGTPVPWSDLRAARPIAVPGGYVFALGSPETGDGRLYRGADGTPWVLDLEAMLPTLAKRTVGAVRGY